MCGRRRGGLDGSEGEDGERGLGEGESNHGDVYELGPSRVPGRGAPASFLERPMSRAHIYSRSPSPLQPGRRRGGWVSVCMAEREFQCDGG